MNRLRYTALSVAFFGLALAATPAQAIFHAWRFTEFFSSADGAVQFIELRTTVNGETGATTAHLHSAFANKTYFFPTNLTGSTANMSLLIATAGFGSLAGGVAPDFPTLALPANFFNPAGDTISLIVSCCGTVDTRTFASVPTDGVTSRNYPANTLLGNTPTNFAGAMGSVNVPPPPTTTGDYNGDGTVNAADYTVWRDTLNQPVANDGDGADGDADGTIDDGDYEFWKLHFGEVLGGAGSGATAAVVPEPAMLALSISGILALILATIRARPVGVRL